MQTRSRRTTISPFGLRRPRTGERCEEQRTPCEHDWRNPVVSKLDPEHVSWTCARCGALQAR